MTLVLAFDIERSGPTLEHQTLAVGHYLPHTTIRLHGLSLPLSYDLRKIQGGGLLDKHLLGCESYLANLPSPYLPSLYSNSPEDQRRWKGICI